MARTSKGVPGLRCLMTNCIECKKEIQDIDDAACIEFSTIFGVNPVSIETVILCDDCYKEFMKRLNS